MRKKRICSFKEYLSVVACFCTLCIYTSWNIHGHGRHPKGSNTHTVGRDNHKLRKRREAKLGNTLWPMRLDAISTDGDGFSSRKENSVVADPYLFAMTSLPERKSFDSNTSLTTNAAALELGIKHKNKVARNTSKISESTDKPTFPQIDVVTFFKGPERTDVLADAADSYVFLENRGLERMMRNIQNVRKIYIDTNANAIPLVSDAATRISATLSNPPEVVPIADQVFEHAMSSDEYLPYKKVKIMMYKLMLFDVLNDTLDNVLITDADVLWLKPITFVYPNNSAVVHFYEQPFLEGYPPCDGLNAHHYLGSVLKVPNEHPLLKVMLPQMDFSRSNVDRGTSEWVQNLTWTYFLNDMIKANRIPQIPKFLSKKKGQPPVCRSYIAHHMLLQRDVIKSLKNTISELWKTPNIMQALNKVPEPRGRFAEYPLVFIYSLSKFPGRYIPRNFTFMRASSNCTEAQVEKCQRMMGGQMEMMTCHRHQVDFAKRAGFGDTATLCNLDELKYSYMFTGSDMISHRIQRGQQFHHGVIKTRDELDVEEQVEIAEMVRTKWKRRIAEAESKMKAMPS